MHSLLAGGLIVLAVMTAPDPDRGECSRAADNYTTAQANVIEALRAYGRCVLASRQRDDCADEMQALDDAHDAFADAVADAKECR